MTTTLRRLEADATGRPDITQGWVAPAPPPFTFVSTITSVLDVVKGLARTSVPANGPRYWQKVNDVDLLLPQHLDAPAALGCVFIAALVCLAVFK